jgi:hypothetical protein
MSTDIRLQPYIAPTPSEIVEFDTEDPNLPGTVFTPDIQGATNTLYVSTDPDTISQTWIWNTTTNLYETYTVDIPNNTPFQLFGTTIDAGGNKTAFIQRQGPIIINSSSTSWSPLYVYNRDASGVANGPLFRRDSRVTSGYALLVQNYKWAASGPATVNQLRVNHDGSLLINDAYTLPNTGGTAGQVLTDNGAGVVSWSTINSEIPQAQIIYVDSVNGVNSASGRGDINTPYLTPEYALANITNTGTITGNTATNTTISAISDAHNATLEVGMYLSGTGIPFGTIIVAKGNQGGNANTVTLSKSTTATATGVTLTWRKIYEVRLNGSFVVASNLFKEGFYINAQTARISWSNFNLFDLTTIVLSTPYYILGQGNYFGTHISSRFINGSGTQISGSTLSIEFGDIETISTTYTFSITLINAIINVRGVYVNARFGYVGSFTGGIFDINFTSYGLLGGLSFSTGNSFTTLSGSHTTPASVNVLAGGYYTKSNANLYGSTSWTGFCCHRGVLNGTSQSLSGDYYIVNRSNAGIISGGGTVTLEGGSNAFINCTVSSNLTLYGSGYAMYDSSAISGIINNYGNLALGIFHSGAGTINNYGNITAGSGGIGSFSGTINNYSYMNLANTGNGAYTFINRGRLYTYMYGILIGTNAKLYNYGLIANGGTLTNGIALINLSTPTSVFDNYGQIEYTSTDNLRSPIQKKVGKLLLRQGSYIKVLNGKSPIDIPILDSGTTTSTTAFKLIQSGQNFNTTVFVGCKVKNTTDDTWATVTAVDSATTITLDIDIMVSGETFEIYGNPDVYYFGVTDNCDGTTYGLELPFGASSIAPNDLVGGTLYENVNY